MTTGVEGVSIVDIIRRSMGEGINNSKRKIDDSEAVETINKKSHLEDNQCEIKREPHYLGHTNDNYFQSYGSLNIKEEPPEMSPDEDVFDSNAQSIKEETSSPTANNEEEKSQSTCDDKYDLKDEPLDTEILINEQNETLRPVEVIPSTPSDILHLEPSRLDNIQRANLVTINKAKNPTKKSPDKYELSITFLQALYLRFHEDGKAFVEELTSNYLADVELENKDLIKISEVRFQNKIMKHLNETKAISIPSKGQNLGSYLDIVLEELTKECTVQKLRDILHELKTSDVNRHASYQTINMKIYGYFQWEYSQQFINILKDIPKLSADADVDKSILGSVEEALRYLIQNERPLKLYADIIEGIAKEKLNFVDTTLINSMNLLRNITDKKCFGKIIVDDLKYDYFINSSTSKFMMLRWKSKLKVTIEDVGDDTFLCLEGVKTDVEAAHEEFRIQVAEGPMLPFGTLQIYSFVTFLLNKITSIQRSSDTFNADKALNEIMELQKEPQSVRRDRRLGYIYEDLHTYIFATRGLQQGKEKLIVLHEFISSYKLSLMRDDLKQSEWKMIQDAFVVLQYKKCNRVSNYQYFLKCLNSMKHTEAIILTLEEYKILSESIAGKSIIEVLGKLVDFDVSFSRIFSLKHATLTIIGSENGILTCKKKLYEFLDRVIIRECNVLELENKLSTALESLWTTPMTKEDALVVFNRIEILNSRNELHMIETLRALYMQLHVYIFGRCRLLNGQNHVSNLRMCYHYVKSEKNTTPEILNEIITSYEVIFGSNQRKIINYKHLLDISSNEMLERNSRRDKNTVCICDSVVRAHFYHNPIARNLIQNYLDETNVYTDVLTVKKFVQNKLLIFSCNTENERKLPIIIKSESVRIFSQKRSNILVDLTVSLQAIAEVKENMTYTKASDIFNAIQYFERNSAPTSLIEEKYQVLNIYLFGCCGLNGGDVHLEVLKNSHADMTISTEDDNFITDKHMKASLVNAYEFIFWKGKKDFIDYDFLLRKVGVVCEDNMQTLPMPNEMYSYLTHVKEGIKLLENCAVIVKIEIQQDLENNTCFARIQGDPLEVAIAVDMLVKEIKYIKIYFDIPFYKTDLITYLKISLKQLVTFDSFLIPVHIILDLEILERLMQTQMSESECLQILELRSSYYIKLHKYLFGVFEVEEGAKHIDTLKALVRELSRTISDKYLDVDIIKSVYNIIKNYLFSADKLSTLNYNVILKQCFKTKDNMNIHFTLSKHVGEYLNSCNDGTESSKFMKQHLETITNTITVKASQDFINELRNYIVEYTLILKKLPMKRNDLIKRIKMLFTRIADSKCRDPKTIWASLRLCKRLDSRFAVDRLPLSYSRLHTYFFGYRQLLDGKPLVQCLGQHDYNLEVIGKPEDVVSIQVLREIYVALQYIEGNEDKGVDYKTLISKSRRKIVMDNIDDKINRRVNIPTGTFIVATEIKAAQREREYLQNTGTGRSLINSIQNSFVHLKFESNFLKLRGSDFDVKQATDRISDYFLMVSTLPVNNNQLQYAIANYMKKLSSNRVDIGHIASLYTDIFKMELQNLDLSRKVNKTLLKGHYHALHMNLFGCLKLLDGEKHFNFLNRFNGGKTSFNESEMRKLYEAYDYVFGSTKKDIDYNLIIRDLCGNKSFYVSKALARLLEIQNRIKKGKDSFIGPSSAASIEQWINLIKEDMFNHEIMISVHKFLGKYEDVRDNKKYILSI